MAVKLTIYPSLWSGSRITFIQIYVYRYFKCCPVTYNILHRMTPWSWYLFTILGQLFSSVLLVCTVWLPQPSYLPWQWSMSMALRSIYYAGSGDKVGVCHSQTHSFTLVGSLSPCDTTVSIKQHGRKGTHRGHVRRPIISMLWFAPMPSWFPGEMVRQTVFATAAWIYCPSCNSCSCSAGDKRDAPWKSRLSKKHTHAHRQSQSALVWPDK